MCINYRMFTVWEYTQDFIYRSMAVRTSPCPRMTRFTVQLSLCDLDWSWPSWGGFTVVCYGMCMQKFVSPWFSFDTNLHDTQIWWINSEIKIWCEIKSRFQKSQNLKFWDQNLVYFIVMCIISRNSDFKHRVTSPKINMSFCVNLLTTRMN